MSPLPAHRGIPVSRVVRHCEGAVRQGLEAERLLRGAQIDAAWLDAQDAAAEIDPAHYLLFTMSTAFQVEDALHGLGQDCIRIGQAAMGIRVMLGCATLEGALRAFERFYGQLTHSARVRLEIEGEWARISMASASPLEHGGHIVDDIALAWVFMCASHFLGRPLPVAEVLVRDSQHFNLGGRHWAIRAPVRVGTTAGLCFPKGLLAARRAGPASDEALWPCFRGWLSFVGIDGLRDPSANSQAGTMASPPSWPQRPALRPASRAERQRVLADRGLCLLRDSGQSVDDVAAELGYSDARSFRRFMKAATGLTPQQIRQRPGVPVDAQALVANIRRLCSMMDPGSVLEAPARDVEFGTTAGTRVGVGVSAGFSAVPPCATR